jgi:hypothetical protein
VLDVRDSIICSSVTEYPSSMNLAFGVKFFVHPTRVTKIRQVVGFLRAGAAGSYGHISELIEFGVFRRTLSLGHYLSGFISRIFGCA